MNKSGTVSIQIISKHTGKYSVIKSLGSSRSPEEIERLERKAYFMIPDLMRQSSLPFLSEQDKHIQNYFQTTDSIKVKVVGPELILGKIYNGIGYNRIEDEMFRHMVITRLVYPGSKLKTIDYLQRYQGRQINKDELYRSMDKLISRYKQEVEQITYEQTKKVLGGIISMVFYDMTTIYFESEDEDDFSMTGFSKDGKHSNPQIYLGLLVGMNGYPIGYQIFQGKISEGKTLVPVLKMFEERFKLNKPIIIADAGLLSQKNIIYLEGEGYEYILGGRIKNESERLKAEILANKPKQDQATEIKRTEIQRLIISYSANRARKDRYNREKGLKRLEKKLGSGKLSKKHVNNRGYNKYLMMNGEIKIEIDYEKFNDDQCWDGLKGYVTNTKLSRDEVMNNYNHLWQIEKAFRISKTDLRIRPIYHRLKDRIEAHICISFCAYSVFKELERILAVKSIQISPQRAIELTKTMYAIEYELPDSKLSKFTNVNFSEIQKQLLDIFA